MLISLETLSSPPAPAIEADLITSSLGDTTTSQGAISAPFASLPTQSRQGRPPRSPAAPAPPQL